MSMQILQKGDFLSSQANHAVTVGSIYKHYSGKLYKVIAIARNSENHDQLQVIYQALYTCPTFGKDAVWSRPYDMFVQMVTVDGKEQPRFAVVNEQLK